MLQHYGEVNRALSISSIVRRSKPQWGHLLIIRCEVAVRV